MDKTVLESLYEIYGMDIVNSASTVDERTNWGNTYDAVILHNAKTKIGRYISENVPYYAIPSIFDRDPEPDIVNHPDHYICGELETIDVIQAWVENFESYCVGNVIKYVSRYKKKNGVEDLKKARWYLDKIINLTENIDKVKEA